MKTVKKFVLPVLAFLFAVVASFTYASNEKLPSPFFRFTSSGQCVQLTESCNESGTPICKVKVTVSPGVTQLFDVYDDQISSTECQTVDRHSLNDGTINP